jgi:thymidylate synthase (FAD)
MKAQYISHYLTDNDVANFARQSFAKLAENFTDEQNSNLIKYLARGMRSGDWEKLLLELMETDTADRDLAHKLAVYMRKIPEHWVPFGHPHISLRMSAPVPIARQLFKHKVGLVESEESRRYISSKPELFIPRHFRASAKDIKQGSAGTHDMSAHWIQRYTEQCMGAIALYEDMIGDGVCPEQARFALPQGVEVNWVWTGSLYAFANVYNQRSDSHAQKEVQDIASDIDQIIAPLFPVSWNALTKGVY